MGQVEVILKDIMKTLTLMLDVKPTTPFVNDVSSQAFGQVKAKEGEYRGQEHEHDYGVQINDQAEQNYLEEDVVPNYGFTADELRDIEEGRVDEAGQKAMYERREKQAIVLMKLYLTQQYNIKHGIETQSHLCLKK